MARSPFALDEGFLERKAGEETQLALQNMEDYSRNYFESTQPAQDAQAARMQADQDSLITNPVGRVLAGSAAELNRGMGEFFGRLANIAGVIEMETGMKAGGLFGRFKKAYLDNATFYDRMVQQRGPTEDILMSIIGGALPGILNFFPGPAGVAVAGAGGYAEKRTEGAGRGEAFIEGVKDAAHRWAVGKVFHALGGKPMTVKDIPGVGRVAQAAKPGFFAGPPGTELSTFTKNVGTMAGIGAADTMISSGGQAGPADVAKGAVSMGVLGSLGGAPKRAGSLSDAEIMGQRRAMRHYDLYEMPEDFVTKKFDQAHREECREFWWDQYQQDPKTFSMKTHLDTPEVILAREYSRDLQQTLDIDTPERRQWREGVIQTLYEQKKAAQQNRQLYIVMGPSASGKSTAIVDKIVKRTGAFNADNDYIKETIPEFNEGLAAGRVHEESDYINKEMIKKALTNGDDIVLPIVGKTLDNVRAFRDKFRDAGYNVHVIYVDLPAEKAARRAVERFLRNGRFIDPDYVINKVDALPRRNFEQIITEGGISSYAAYNADVAKGQPYKPIAEWTSREFAGGRVPGTADLVGTGRADAVEPAAAAKPAAGAAEPTKPEPGVAPEPATAARVAFGRPANIHHAEGQDAARFALVDAADIQASHDPLRGFALNPNYPGNEVTAEGRNRMLAQERPYHLDKDLQGKVADIAAGVKPEFLIGDSPDAINGPPILTPNMMVPGGNRRAMALRLMYEQNPDQAAIYKNYLAQNAERFGLDPKAVASMERPVLARMLMNAETDADINAFTRRVRLYNQSFTAGLEANSEYVSKARLLSGDSLRILADGLEGDTTLREYLGKAKSYDLFKALVNDGVIEETKVSTYFNEKTGTLTQQGKALIEGVLRGKVIDDIDLLAAAPPAALQRIDRAVPFLAKVKGSDAGWDLTAPLKTALEEYTKFKRTPFNTGEEYLAQQSLFGSSAEFSGNPQAVRLFRMLDEMTPTQFANRMAGYARAAELAAKVKDQGDLGFFKPLDPADAFRKYVEDDAVIDQAASPVEQYRIAQALMGHASPKVVLGELSENIMNELPAVAARRPVSMKNQLSLLPDGSDLPLFGAKGPTPAGMDRSSRTLDKLDIFDNLKKDEIEEAPPVRTLGKKIDEELIETGEIRWEGKQVESIEDLALAMQIYRDPRWETHRIFYAKQNEDGTFTILHHAGLSQRLPDRAMALHFPPGYKGDVVGKGIESIEKNMEKYGATHVFTAHNHPGTLGGVSASQPDMVMEHTFADRLGERWAGSIIIDGENFRVGIPRHDQAMPVSNSQMAASLKANGCTRLIPINADWKPVPGPDKFAGQKIPHEKIGTIIDGPASLAAHVKDLATNPDYAVLVIRSNQGKINLIQEVHLDVLKDIEKARPLIQDAARNNGGHALLYIPHLERMVYGHIRQLLKNSLVWDVVSGGKGRPYWSGVEQGMDGPEFMRRQYTLGKLGNEWPVYQVREIQAAYGRPLFPDISDPTGPNGKMIRAAAEEFLEKKAADLDVIPDLELNWRRIDTESDVQEVLNRTIAIFENPELAAKGYQPHEMTVKLAEDLGMTAEGLIKANGGKAFSATEVTAMRWLHLSSARKLLETAKIAARSTDEADAYAFRKQLATHYAIQCQFYKYRAEAGRALNAWKIQARESETMMKELSDALMQTGGAGTARDMALKILALERPEQIATFARQAHQATTMDMALEAWINGLLSNPTTHVVNIAGNTASMAWQVPERWLAAKISKYLDPQQEIYEGEAKQMLYGMVQGFKDALMLTVRGKDAIRKAGQEMAQMDLASAKETLNQALTESKNAELPIFGETAGDFGPAWKTLLEGEPSGQFGKMELARKLAISGENVKANFPRLAEVMQKNGFDLSLAMDFLGETVRTPGRMLMVEDEFFKSGAYRMELHARAFREASKEGLTGEAFSRRVQEIIATPPTDIQLAAKGAADYLTFTNKLNESENLFAKASGKLQEMAGTAPALRFVVPFIRTPVNIFAFTLERTPLGLFVKSIRNDIFNGSGAERALAIARMSLGSMVMATAYELVMSDLVTGGGPGDRELREAKRRAGWQPYSIKIGDRYVSYNRLDPFGSIVGMAADAAEMWNHLHEEGVERDRDKLATMVIASLAKNLVNKTYMEGFARIVDVIHDPQRYGEGWMKQFLGSFVPSGVAHLERLIDPTIAETQGALDAIKARIPGLSADLPPKRNLWGEVIHFQGALGPDIVSPFYQSRETGSPIDDEIVRNRVDSIRTPTARGVFSGVELSPHQISRFQEIMGQEIRHDGLTLREYLNAMIQTPAYQDLTDGPMGGKAFQIARVVHQYREEAKNLMIHEDPELRMKILGIKARKVEARTGRKQPDAGGMPVFQ